MASVVGNEFDSDKFTPFLDVRGWGGGSRFGLRMRKILMSRSPEAHESGAPVLLVS